MLEWFYSISSTAYTDWPYSSFHRYVKQEIYPLDWVDDFESELVAGE